MTDPELSDLETALSLSLHCAICVFIFLWFGLVHDPPMQAWMRNIFVCFAGFDAIVLIVMGLSNLQKKLKI